MTCLKVDESSLEGVEQKSAHVECMVLVNRRQEPVSSEVFVNRILREYEFPNLSRIVIGESSMMAESMRLLVNLEEICAPSVKMSEEEVCEVSKRNDGILISAGGFIYRNGKSLPYWDGVREIL